MKKEQAKKVLMMLNRISQEIDIFGNVLLKRRLAPISNSVKYPENKKFKK